MDPRFLNPITVLTDVGGIKIDVTRKIVETYENKIQENPTESGFSITDNITLLPVKMSIEGGFSDIFINRLIGSLDPRHAIVGRSKGLFDALLAVGDSKKPFTVINGLHQYKNMVIKELQLIKDKPDFAISFSLQLWEIIIVGAKGAGNGKTTGNRGSIAASSKISGGVV